MLEPGRNIAAWIDQQFLPGKMWQGNWDPEGILSTFPSIVTGITGMLAGKLMISKFSPNEKSNYLMAAGLFSAAAGYFWGLAFPVNENLWTSSFVLVTSGFASMLLGALYFLVDILGRTKGTAPGVIFGANAITAYVLADIFALVFYLLPIGGQTLNQHAVRRCPKPGLIRGWRVCCTPGFLSPSISFRPMCFTKGKYSSSFNPKSMAAQRLKIFMLLLFLLCKKQLVSAQSIDFSKSQIFATTADKNVLLRSIEVLQSEVEKRSGIKLLVPKNFQKAAVASLFHSKKTLPNFPKPIAHALAALPATKAEGLKILVIKNANTVLVIGNDARGILFGVGRLLRKMQIKPGSITLPEDLALSTSPTYPVRGHQLGYRPKTNAYDAFTVARFDQYIRELALFGANTIEILPPRTDDDSTSRHMKVPAAK
jgi:hypothetical protein